MSAEATVLIADDHTAARMGIRLALDGHGFRVCAETDNAPAAVELALRERPEVCLLDIYMPGNGIAAAAEIAARVPETTIVMLTVSRDDADLFEALRSGASGYLLKDTKPDRLPLALRGVLDGEAALPRSLVSRLLNEFRARDQRRATVTSQRDLGTLTDREWQVLECLRESRSTAEIAQRLEISQTTVRRHTSTIVRKLRVSSREEAARMFNRQ